MAPRSGSKNVVDTSRLSGAEKCAVILLALGEEAKKIERAHRFPPGKKA